MKLPATNHKKRVPLTKSQGGSEKIKSEGPDLVIDSFEMSNDTPFPGQRISFDVTVKNQGNVRSESFDVKLRGQGLKRKTKRAKALEPGQSQTFEFGPTRLHFPGVYSFEARADTENEVRETREDNNWHYSVISVKDPFPPRDPFPRPPFPPRK